MKIRTIVNISTYIRIFQKKIQYRKEVKTDYKPLKKVLMKIIVKGFKESTTSSIYWK